MTTGPRNVDALHRPGGAISGTVRDQNGTPLANRTLYLSLVHHPSFLTSAVTDAHGNYRAVDLQLLTYRVCVGLYTDDCYRAGSPPSARVQVTNGEDVTGVDIIRSVKDNHVSVTTVDAAGHALAGADDLALTPR